MSKNAEVNNPVFAPKDLREYRMTHGLTQRQFAKKCGIPLGTIRNWEQGLSIPNISFAKFQLINLIIEWVKKVEIEKEIALAKEKKARHKIKLSKKSPLRYRDGETQGQWWDRIGKIAIEIIQEKRTSKYSIQRLAFIIQELPSDFSRSDKDDIFLKTKIFFAELNNQIKRTFELTYLAHNGNERRCSWLLSKS